MTEAAWLSVTRFHTLSLFALNPEQATPRKRTLLACACCRLAQDWALPDLESDAIDATERYVDDELGRRAWMKRAQPLQAKDPAWTRAATEWERDFRAAVLSLFYGLPDWSVPGRLIRAVERVSSPDYAEAFEGKVCSALRDIIGNPFRAVALSPDWRTGTVTAIAKQMYSTRDFGAMPILADALQDSGCDSDDILTHCRSTSQVHVRGCWVIDLVLGKT